MSIEPSHKILRKNISSKNLSNPCSLIISLPDLLHKSLPLKFYAKVFHRKTFPPVHPPLGAFPWISTQKYFFENLPPVHAPPGAFPWNSTLKYFIEKLVPPPCIHLREKTNKDNTSKIVILKRWYTSEFSISMIFRFSDFSDFQNFFDICSILTITNPTISWCAYRMMKD